MTFEKLYKPSFFNLYVKKFLALTLIGLIVIGATITLIVVFVSDKHEDYTFFNGDFPSNSTSFTYYSKVPFMVPMRDGIKLATDVLVPLDLSEPASVILIRTPYDKNIFSFLASFIFKGHIIIIQDMRGFGESEGYVDLPFLTEKADGHDILLWIAEQAWCNGRVGTWGPSALGIAQYLLAPDAPEVLKCQLPIVATPNSYDAVFTGGQLRRELILPWLDQQGFSEDSLEIIKQNEKPNGIWNDGSIVDIFSDIHSPALHVGGWYDIFVDGPIEAFQGYQYQGGVGAAGNSKLVMGPWVHGGMFGERTGLLDYPNQDFSTIFSLTDALFDKWLNSNSTLWDMLPTVSFYLMSSIDYNPSSLGNNWFQANDWPLETENINYYFYPNQSLLSTPPSESEGFISYLYDPSNPVPTNGGGNLNLDRGAYDQQEVELRDDVLVFTSPVLKNPLVVLGKIEVQLFISSNCTDTDFTVKLTDVYPDGTSMLITDTVLRARNRNSLSEWDFLTNDTVYTLSIPLESTAYLFNENHKIGIDISSSNFPRFEANPNTGDSLWNNETFYVANNTVYTNSIYNSSITVPSYNYNDLIPFSFNTFQLKKTSLKTVNITDPEENSSSEILKEFIMTYAKKE